MGNNSRSHQQCFLPVPFNKDGMSLVSVMVAVGLLGIVATGTLALFENMSKSQNMADLRSQSLNFVEEVRAHLSDRNNCKATLQAVTLTNGNTTPLTHIKNGNDTNKWSINTEYANKTFKISSLMFQYNPGDSAPPAPALTGFGSLDIQVSTEKRVAGTSTLAPKSISIRIVKSATGALVDCIAFGKSTDGLWQRSPSIGNIYYAAGNVAIGTNEPTAKLDVAGNLKIASTSVDCDSTTEGSLRFNSVSKQFEGCNGTAWGPLGGAGLVSKYGTSVRCPGDDWISACWNVPGGGWNYNLCLSRGHATSYGWSLAWNSVGYRTTGALGAHNADVVCGSNLPVATATASHPPHPPSDPGAAADPCAGAHGQLAWDENGQGWYQDYPGCKGSHTE